MHDIILASIVRYSASFFSLLTSLLLARILGSDDFGRITFIIFSCTAFSAISSFSIQRIILILYSSKKIDAIRIILSSYLFVIIFSSLFGFFAAFYKYDMYISISCFMLIAGLQWQLFSPSLVMISESYLIRKNQFFFFIGRFLSFITLYVLTGFYSEFRLLLFIYSFFVFLPFSLEIILIYKRYLNNLSFDVKNVISDIKEAKWMHLDTVFSQVIIFSSSFVFSIYGKSSDLGVYNLSLQIITSSLIVISVFQVYIARIIKDNISSNEIKYIFKCVSIFSIVYLVIMFLGALFLYKFYYHIGDGFENIYIYICIMSFAGFFSIFNKTMIPIFVKLEYTKFISISTMFSGVVSLAISLILTLNFGGFGAAVSFIFGYFISFCFFGYKISEIYK